MFWGSLCWWRVLIAAAFIKLDARKDRRVGQRSKQRQTDGISYWWKAFTWE